MKLKLLVGGVCALAVWAAPAGMASASARLSLGAGRAAIVRFEAAFPTATRVTHRCWHLSPVKVACETKLHVVVTGNGLSTPALLVARDIATLHPDGRIHVHFGPSVNGLPTNTTVP